MSFERLWRRLEDEGLFASDGVLEPDGLEVLSWIAGGAEPRFMPVMCLTRRQYEGDIVELRTKMGRRIRCTPDHPWIVGDGTSGGDLELCRRRCSQRTTGSRSRRAPTRVRTARRLPH